MANPDGIGGGEVTKDLPTDREFAEWTRFQESEAERRWSESPEAAGLRRWRIRVVIIWIAIMGLLAFGVFVYQQRKDNEVAAARNRFETAQTAATDAADALAVREAAKARAQDALETADVLHRSTDVLDVLAEDLRMAQAAVGAASEESNRRAEAARITAVAIRTVEARERQVETYWIVWLVAVFVTGFIAFGITLSTENERRRQYQNRGALEWLAAVNKDKAEQVESGDTDPLDLVALWDLNRVRLESYHTLVTNYAASTRQFTQIVLVSGFVFLTVLGVVALVSRSAAASVATSIVAVAGAGLGGFISRTVLQNADSSSKEVLSFFAHPIEVERFLSAERLIRSMPAKDQPEARLVLVHALARRPQP